LETLQVSMPTAIPEAAEAGEISADAAPNMAASAAATRNVVFTFALLLPGDVRRRSEQHSALSAPSLIRIVADAMAFAGYVPATDRPDARRNQIRLWRRLCRRGDGMRYRRDAAVDLAMLSLGDNRRVAGLVDR